MMIQNISYNFYNTKFQNQNKSNALHFGKLSDMPMAEVAADKIFSLAKDSDIPKENMPTFLRKLADLLSTYSKISIEDISTCLSAKSKELKPHKIKTNRRK